MDDNSRPVSGFNEIKDYIKNYPYSMKYNIEDVKVQEIANKVIDDWTRQYRTLSNFVHGTNSNFFQKTEYVDGFKFVKKDINFLAKQVEILSSIVNTLLIIFYTLFLPYNPIFFTFYALCNQTIPFCVHFLQGSYFTYKMFSHLFYPISKH